MGITFALITGGVLRTSGPAAVDMKLRDGLDMLTALGFSADPAAVHGEVQPADLLGRLLLADALTPADEGVPTTEDGRWTTGGRSEGWTQRKLAELRTLAELAQTQGVPVGWS